MVGLLHSHKNMVRKQKQILGVKMKTGLTTFITNQCANWVGYCLLNDGDCKVMNGKRCKYFEKSVLGPPEYKYRTAGYNYERLFPRYAKINKNLTGTEVKVRRCGCGAILKRRERYCEKCRIKRRKESYRKSRESMKGDE